MTTTARAISRDQLENFGSIVTFKDKPDCLGDLWHVNGHTFCPHYGLVPVTEEEAKQHNAALDAARIQGLDAQCEIGQGSNFYLTQLATYGWQVVTFSGTVVASNEDLYVSRHLVTMRRGDRVFQGRRHTKDDCIFLKRVS